MTTLLMAILVDDGVMTWDTPVVEILPSFSVSDPEITQILTVQHLVCACSGVPRRDNEWMLNASELTAEDMIESLATFEFFTDFGEAYQYSNQMVTAGGYVAASAAGGEYGHLEEAYRDLLQQRVLDPIGMPSTTFSFEAVETTGNYATPYGSTMAFDYVPLSLDVEQVLLTIGPAGGLWSNVLDMADYMIMLMNEGVTPDGTRIVSVENLHYLWEPQIAMSATASYGLGWMIKDFYGLPIYSHAGNTYGFSSEFMFLPDTGLGIVVQTNQRGSVLNDAVALRFFELAFDVEPEADSAITYVYNNLKEQMVGLLDDLLDEVIVEDAEAMVGTWSNDALGSVIVTFEEGKLVIDFGEFASELRQFDPESDPAADKEGPLFVIYDPPIGGVPVIFIPGEDGNATLLYGSGVDKYTFTR